MELALVVTVTVAYKGHCVGTVPIPTDPALGWRVAQWEVEGFI
jgi:hypothetical protein